jgi:hypothetical protein
MIQYSAMKAREYKWESQRVGRGSSHRHIYCKYAMRLNVIQGSKL